MGDLPLLYFYEFRGAYIWIQEGFQYLLNFRQTPTFDGAQNITQFIKI